MNVIEKWGKLSERFSLIPLKGKKPIEFDWQKWCRVKRPFDPKHFVRKNAGVACGPASRVLVLDIDHAKFFKELRLEREWELPDCENWVGKLSFLLRISDYKP
jgi:hypothetical protein